MNVLHIIPTYIPASLASGPIQSIHSLNSALVKLGVTVTVYTSNRDGDTILDVPIGKEVIVDGVRVYYFPITFSPWSYSRQLERALQRNVKDFDVIHISSIFLSFLTLGAHYARKYNVPYIVTSHGMLMRIPLKSKSFKKRIYLSLIEKKNLAYAAALHFTTKSEKEEYLATGLPWKRILVVPHSIPLTASMVLPPTNFFRKKFLIPSDKKIIFFLGRLNWIKGFDTLIPAFSEVVKQEPKAALVIAGPDGGYEKEIDFLISTFDLQKKVFFTGELDSQEKTAVLRESVFLVLPSYSENFGIVAIEAMAEGIPVVLTEGVGISSSVSLFDAGLIVKKNIEQLSGAMLSILSNPARANEMGMNGKRFVESEFSPKKIALAIKTEYEEILKVSDHH